MRTPRSQKTVDLQLDIDSEQLILAATLKFKTSREKLVARFTDTVPFLEESHRQIWAVVVAMAADDLEYDVDLLRVYLPEEIVEYVILLVERVDSEPKNLEYHVQRVFWNASKKNLVVGPLKRFLSKLQEKDSTPDELHLLFNGVADHLKGSSQKHVYDTQAVVSNQSADIARRMQGRAVYPLGLTTLDNNEEGMPRLVPGLAPKMITVVTGVSGSGKSTLVDRIILNQLLGYNRKVAVGAWEMNPGVTIEILATMASGFSRSKVVKGDLTKVEYQTLVHQMQMIQKNLVFVKLPKLRTNKEVVGRLIDTVEDSGASLFVGDLLRKAFVRYSPDEEESALNAFQDRLARSDIHAMVVQQQRMKDIEMRIDKRPTREGVKGSSAWVEVADTVLGVHRAAQWKNIKDQTLEVDILKQRYGVWPLAVLFEWDPELASIDRGISIPYEVSLDEEEGGRVETLFKKRKHRAR